MVPCYGFNWDVDLHCVLALVSQKRQESGQTKHRNFCMLLQWLLNTLPSEFDYLPKQRVKSNWFTLHTDNRSSFFLRLLASSHFLFRFHLGNLQAFDCLAVNASQNGRTIKATALKNHKDCYLLLHRLDHTMARVTNPRVFYHSTQNELKL